MYKILGGDGKEYGPVSVDVLRQWVREGRANALTQIKAEGAAHWQALSSLPELAEVFSAGASASKASPALPTGATAPGAIHDGDYELDILGCVSRAFDLFKVNMGVMILATLLAFSPQIIGGVLRLFGMIPLIGIIFSLLGFLVSMIAFVVSGPLQGGLFAVFLKLGRGERAEAGDVFGGFKSSFLHLFLGQFIRGLLVGLCLIPFFVVLVVTVVVTIIKNPQHAPPEFSAFIPSAAVLLITLPFVIWLSVNWVFTLALVIDKNLDFWTAMKTSWRQVMRHWWSVFGLCIVIAIINFLGALFCFVGLIFTQPIAIATLMQAYETIFNPRTAQPGPRA